MLLDGVGDMTWLARHQALRLSPQQFWPQAQSLVVATHAYQPEPLLADGLQQARYAAGKDYHGLFRKKLSRLGQTIDHASHLPRGSSRAVVDSAPVDERRLAFMAGLGWLGKNALIITPRRGSYQFLGVLFSAARLEHQVGPHGADRCGACHACETTCPTQALVERRVLSERCISYLTIEHHGVIDAQLAEHFQGWWYGCDQCQIACPWNRFAPAAGDGRLTGRPRRQAALLALQADQFDHAFAGSAVRRLGFARFRRNLVVALSSLGRHEEAQLLARDGPALAVEQARALGLDP
jgi:epoxyqueuosine reductase